MPGAKGRLLITGAGGFVGSNLTRIALNKGWNVVGFSRTPERLDQFASAQFRAELWPSDDDRLDTRLLSDVDAICHLAAFVPPDHEDSAYALECFRVNALGTLKLAQLAAEAKIGRFVAFSGGLMYAPSPQPATEGSPLYPAQRATYYLSSKLTAELFLQHTSLVKNLPVSILRASSVYGPGMNPKSMIPQFIKRISDGSTVEIRDGGKYSVDFVHVDDVAAAALAAIERRADGVFNVGSGETRTNLAVALLLVSLLKADEKCIQVTNDSGSAAPPDFPALDISKAKALLGYKPLDLEQGLTKLLANSRITVPK